MKIAQFNASNIYVVLVYGATDTLLLKIGFHTIRNKKLFKCRNELFDQKHHYEINFKGSSKYFMYKSKKVSSSKNHKIKKFLRQDFGDC